jgi:hypothetical protein
MAVTDNEVKDKARSLGSGKRPSSELDNWLRDNGATASQGNLAGREYGKAYDAATSNTQTSNTQNTKRSLTNPIDVAKAMATGVSPKSEMGSQFKVDMEGLTNYKTAASTLQNEIFKQLERESQLHTTINEKIGITGELSRAYRDIILETVPMAATLGFDMENLGDLVTGLGEKSGRFNILSQKTMENSLVTTRAFGSSLRDMSETMSEFEKVGFGAADTLEKIDTAGRSSISLGLNAKKTTEMLKTDLGKLNEYGFSNGVQGLNRMIQKSLEFRTNMNDVFKIADKVMSPDSAIELTANLQVLGGAIGDFNDPLKLMYMATNNVEGLQDALIGAAGGLATYNKEQGRFEVTGANLRRAKEMASQLGMSTADLNKTAIAAQERIQANNVLLAKGFDMNSKDREFLTNMSQMKDGKMSITIPESLTDKFGKQTEVTLDSLTQSQIDVLKANRKAFEDMNPEQIAKQQFSSVKNIENMLQGAGLKSVKVAKDKAFGRNEYTGDTEYKGAVPLEKIAQENLKWATDFSDKTLKGVATNFGNEMDKYTKGFISATGDLESMIKKQNDKLREFLMGDKSGRSGLEKYDKEKKDYYERSNPRTNEFVIKSQIEVTNKGFNMEPAVNVKGTPYIMLYNKK